MRLALALVSLTLVTSLVAAEPQDGAAEYAADDVCIVGGTYVLGAGIPVGSCAVSHEGSVTFVGCEANMCALDVAVHAELTGAPAGQRSLVTSVDDSRSSRFVSDVCRAEAISTESSLSCDGAFRTIIEFGSDCRFLVVGTVGAVGVAAGSNKLLSTFRVCLTETGATLEAV